MFADFTIKKQPLSYQPPEEGARTDPFEIYSDVFKHVKPPLFEQSSLANYLCPPVINKHC